MWPSAPAAMRIARCSRSRWPLCGATPWGSLPLRSPRPSSKGSTRALIGKQPATRPPRSPPSGGCCGATTPRPSTSTKSDPNDPLALDGKTLKIWHQGPSALRLPAPASVAQIEVGRENQRNPRAQAPAGAPGYPGVVTADAMHTQRETARFLVEADSLFIAKNQKSIREDLAALGHDDFSPCRHPVR